ncbi:MAG: flagellar basal body P-ring formation chaperone FlgA [Dissulfurimicrobium sp.]|uniref:flagellar basal body P-ring formation chaperone FlgA n=1 Tax=Dissulfurimicrobium TaxID=1769732 RepID=UPI001ED9DD89|nr:flagellar basal body P-ring formation chaperone FlgA [Dissulfurimicrobium hydrothermale]UKL13715.1 flagellar basal body P-ring formation chaperone FlgA [Dissulfurimicrobium hydrothermale]
MIKKGLMSGELRCLLRVIFFMISAILLLGHDLAAADQGQVAQSQKTITTDDFSRYFRQEISRRIPWADGEIEIMRFQTFPPEVTVPSGKVEIETEAPAGERPLGMFTCIFTVKVDGKIKHRVRGCGFVEIYRPVVCAAKALPKGHILSLDDINMIRQPISRIYDSFFDDPAKVTGLALTRFVQPGQILTDRMVAQPLVVHRGDIVTIVADSPSFTITTPGKVMQDGALGEAIKVQNIMSKREIVAVVKDAKTVSVRF